MKNLNQRLRYDKSDSEIDEYQEDDSFEVEDIDISAAVLYHGSIINGGIGKI